MTLLSGEPASVAISGLAKTFRAGVLYSRGDRMKKVRAHLLPQLKRYYESQDSGQFRIPISRRPRRDPGSHQQTRASSPTTSVPDDYFILPPASQEVKCICPDADGVFLPTSWGARFYERLCWPLPDRNPGQSQHPFRLFLEITRGGNRWDIPVYDMLEPWLGPVGFKVRFTRLSFPLHPAITFSSYLVFGDRMTDLSLCRWLTVWLDQRSMLTKEEKDETFQRFFVGRSGRGLLAKLEAYRRVMHQFVQPIGGNPSFPTYYRKTSGPNIMAESLRSMDDGETGLRKGKYEVRHDRAETLRDLDATSAFEPTERDRAKFCGNTHTLVLPGHIPLKAIRYREPNLHRALLDRIKQGRVTTKREERLIFVLAADVDVVNEERERNAESRKTKTFERQRKRWIMILEGQGLKHQSAARKLKRWMNSLGLSEAEIEGSVAKGRLVRSTRRSQRT